MDALLPLPGRHVACAPRCPRPPVAPATHDRGARDEDRARILDAVAWLAAEEGYRQLTVPRIRAAAGVSRKRFDEHFEDVQGCFIAALEHLTERALAHAVPAGAPPGPGRAACTARCARCARISRPIRCWRGWGSSRCSRRAGRDALPRARDRGPRGELADQRTGGQRPSELAAEASVGAVWGIVHHHIALGRAHRCRASRGCSHTWRSRRRSARSRRWRSWPSTRRCATAGRAASRGAGRVFRPRQPDDFDE